MLLSRNNLNIKACVCDDPGGHRSKLDKLYNKSCRLRAADIRALFFRKTDHVYDIDIVLKSNHMYYLKIIPDKVFPEPVPGEYMKRLELVTIYHHLKILCANQEKLAYCAVHIKQL